ncbi:MAG: 5'-nucleotidase C-terminal domain-containing protein [Flavobacteriaceae bacterium]
MKTPYILLGMCLLFLSACKNDTPAKLHQIKATQLKTDSTIIPQQAVTDFITPFKTHLNEQLDAILCTSPIDLTRTDAELESSLGNLMADICYEQGTPLYQKQTGNTVDFVLFNYGGIRAPIAQGHITARHAFEVMPFENELVVVELSGDKIKELLNYLAINKKAHPISKLRLQLTKDSYTNVTISDKKFDASKNYFVMTSDYLQEGGDNMNFFKNPVSLHKTGYKIRTALIDYFKKKDSIIPNLDNRFTYAN